MSDDPPILSAVEARILGCLIEKKDLTPDVYPLTLNAALAAANQKTAREPVMALEPVEVRRALAQLEQRGLVRQAFASRVERYEHAVAQRFALTSPQITLLGLMLLRGPQTAYELLARGERAAQFGSIDDLRGNLDLMIGRRPPLVQHIDRGPGQREDRFAHLLSGSIDITVLTARQDPPPQAASHLEARVRTLEEQVASLSARLEALAEGR